MDEMRNYYPATIVQTGRGGASRRGRRIDGSQRDDEQPEVANGDASVARQAEEDEKMMALPLSAEGDVQREGLSRYVGDDGYVAQELPSYTDGDGHKGNNGRVLASGGAAAGAEQAGCGPSSNDGIGGYGKDEAAPLSHAGRGWREATSDGNGDERGLGHESGLQYACEPRCNGDGRSIRSSDHCSVARTASASNDGGRYDSDRGSARKHDGDGGATVADVTEATTSAAPTTVKPSSVAAKRSQVAKSNTTTVTSRGKQSTREQHLDGGEGREVERGRERGGQPRNGGDVRDSGGVGDRYALDVAGPLRTTDDGERYVIAAVEYVKRYALVVTVKRHTAENVAAFLMRNIVLKFGAFRELLTDGAPELTGKAIE
ncbi:unnamed protein product [Phytophthora fragariaefolia]|uniref:Unnamed protein product n=1 Tax=Phytophthora fragariaefolia TaxID=1490495 RepID=A0A9W7D0L4_9STRA|nr:unnamed protein product [Phytophthora fragariaefolia]